MFSWWRKIIPTKNERELKKLWPKVALINQFAEKFKDLSDAELQAKTAIFRERFSHHYQALGGDPTIRLTEGTKAELKIEKKRIDAALEPLLAEAYATVREASRRVLGLYPYDVQLIGALALHEGKIAEMKTGEGKTLAATLPAYLNALAGRGVHIVTVNEYLASRDADWMGKIYRYLGMSCSVILHGLSDSERQAAYQAEITYGTNSEFGFDYLRDNMKLSLSDYVQRGAHFAIVDEVDSILIDEARTPLIISGPAEESTEKYAQINQIIPALRREQDYAIDEKSKTVVLTEAGVHNVEKRLNIPNLYEPENIEILHHVNQALRAHTLFKRNVDYMVEDGKVKIIDEFTGRVLDGRRWSDGLHQAVEAKESVHIENENQTLATITYQNLFRMYLKLAGMTGTAETEAEEFAKIYDLDVLVVPTNKSLIREDFHDLIYKTEAEKLKAITQEIQERHQAGQPCLVGTISVEKSEILSKILHKLAIPHNVLNAKYHKQEAKIIAQAGRLGAVTIATNMAGRGTDILLGGNPEFLAENELTLREDDPQAEKLRAEFQELLKKYRERAQQEKAQVLQAGGLHIIGTERHESRRIDNQLRGRSGRQGDPGSSRFYISLEDDLMRIFGGDRILHLMERLGMQEGEVIEHPWVNKSIESAQKRVEGHNFDIRKHLLEYDDVMNDQRSSIYKLRRTVLSSDIATTKELLLDLIEDLIINMVDRSCNPHTSKENWDLHELALTAKEQFNLEISLQELEELELDNEVFKTTIFAKAQDILDKQTSLYSSEAFYHITRIIYLQTIDNLWKDHLRDMDDLREGINLRGYAQKDPKQEYKKEGYNLFARMMQTISSEVVSKALRMMISTTSEEELEEHLQARHHRQQRELRLNDPANAPTGTSVLRKSVSNAPTARALPEAPLEAPKMPVRTYKVGRNDPCPCGSGKKHKKCCALKEPPHAA